MGTCGGTLLVMISSGLRIGVFKKGRDDAADFPDIKAGTRQLVTVKFGNAAFGGDNGASLAIIGAEVPVARGNDAANKGSIRRVVEEVDHLFWYRCGLFAAAVGGDEKNVGIYDLDHALTRGAQRYANGW